MDRQRPGKLPEENSAMCASLSQLLMGGKCCERVKLSLMSLEPKWLRNEIHHHHRHLVMLLMLLVMLLMLRVMLLMLMSFFADDDYGCSFVPGWLCSTPKAHYPQDCGVTVLHWPFVSRISWGCNSSSRNPRFLFPDVGSAERP